MSNDNAFRELRFSPVQLVIVFLSILVLGIFVFLLGISVGKKQTLVQAQARPVNVEKSAPDSVKSPIKVGEPATKTATAEMKTETDAAAAAKPEKAAPEKAAPPETKTTAIPEPKPAVIEAKPANPPAANFKSAPYYFQIGAVETRAAADAYAKRVTGLGFPTLILDPLATDKKPIFRVRVGPYPSKTEATDALAALATALKKKTTDFFLVKS